MPGHLMIVRFDSAASAPRAKRAPFAQPHRAMRTAFAAACFLMSGFAAAQGASAPSAGTAAAGSGTAATAATANIVGQYSIRPGQSLHDVAVDLTQSHDKAALTRMASALFEANPQAFNRHDPSLLRAGAVLNVPSVPDLSSAASGVTAASAPNAAAPVSAPTAGAAAAASNAAGQASAAAAAANAATAAANTAAASASSANAAANAANGASAAQAVSAAASAPSTAASDAASSAAATAASAAAASAAASDSHVYSGAVQASASTPASAATSAGASAPVHASSLQQLLALKNRVLMALQQHGIGKPDQAAHVAGANGASAGPGAAPAQTATARTNAADASTDVSPVTWGIVVAVLVALIAVIVGLLTRRRKPPQAADDHANMPPAAAVAEPELKARDDARHPPATEAAPDPREPLAPAPAAEAQARAEAPHRDETLARASEAASLQAAASLGAEALPPTLTEPLHPVAEAPTPAAETEDRAAPAAHSAHDSHESRGLHEAETLRDATEAASVAAAAELGAAALPPESMTHETPPPAPRTEAPEPLAPSPARAAPDLTLDFGDDLGQTPRPASAHAPAPQPPAEPEALPQPPASPTETARSAAPAAPVEDMNYVDVPAQFPRDAVEALGDIGLPLPPRVSDPVAPAPSLASQPLTPPDATGRPASPFEAPPAPFAGEAIEAGLIGAGALAGLGAPRFGALTLDFDLDLPPESAEPLPVFTPEQLTRIARNKLDLAQEYIALGDVSGARSLINEVIESNDHATRADAQALLSTLAPLS